MSTNGGGMFGLWTAKRRVLYINQAYPVNHYTILLSDLGLST